MIAGIGQVWRREMKCLLVAAMLAALVWPAGAAQRYDRKLEEQVKQIVAAKIGDIRGTLPYDRIMVFPAVDQGTEESSFQTLQSLPRTGEPHFQIIE
jgi:hypothetical protein